MSVEISGLTKKFGQQAAVDNISFTVNQGEIVGFLGPNGAGKSTTMKIITTYLPPTQGNVTIFGQEATQKPLQIRKNLGYLPEHNPLYLDMYVKEYLPFVGRLYGLKGKILTTKVAEMIALTGLTSEQHKKLGALSKGYRQRVGLAQALIHDPKVLILDEPTTGLDPNQIVEIRNLIKLMSKDKIVILSTHIMQEVQALCDRAIIINKGKIVADGKVSELQGNMQQFQILSLEFSAPVDLSGLHGVQNIESIEEVDELNYTVKVSGQKDMRSQIFKLAGEKDWPLVGLKKEENTMEKIFQQLTKS
jgi:ABC-2 type transport system ATP-binding protein